MFTVISIGVLLAVASYLIGSVPVAYILVKALTGTDVRTVGSGNVGATNAGRVLGKPGFIAVLALDALKGFLPVFLALKLCLSLQLPRDIALFCAAAVILGHAFPLYLRFSGGKGVATGLGVFTALAPLPVLTAVLTFLILVGITRMVSVGSIFAALVNTAAVFFFYPDWLGLSIFTSLVAIFVIYKHKSNIKRILAGTENKVFSK